MHDGSVFETPIGGVDGPENKSVGVPQYQGAERIERDVTRKSKSELKHNS
jgi:hypothetical protein